MREREGNDEREIEKMKITLARHGDRLTVLEGNVTSFFSEARAIFQKISTFMDKHEATESARVTYEQEQEKTRNRHYAWVIAILTFFTLIAISAGSVVAYYSYISAKHIGAVSDSPTMYSANPYTGRQ